MNQSNGVEWSYEDCLVTDARFLELFLSSGRYDAAAALFREEGKAPVLYPRTLYTTAEEKPQSQGSSRAFPAWTRSATR